MKRMKEKPDISLWTLICRILPLNYQASPIWFIGNQVGSILHGLLWGVGVLATQLFFDGVTGLVNGTVPNGQAITMLLVMSLVTVVQQILNGVSNFSLNQFSKLCLGHLGQILHGKTARIDPVCFEDPALLDDINKADEGKNNCMGLVFVMTSLFTFYLPYILFMAIYLLTLKPVLTLTIPLVFIPVLLTQIIRGTVFTKLEDQSAPIRREADCYEAAICDRTFFKETRILGAFPYFFSLLTESMQLLKFKKWQAEFRTGLLELGTRLLTLTGYLVILYLLVTNLISGEISIGAFAAVFTSIDMLFGIMEEIVCRHIGYMSKNLGTVRNFIRFLDLPERSGNTADLSAREIVLDAVSFRYPGQSEKAIESVTLRIDAGETVAIVGENGAGKTTLVRLLTGLYLPSSGQVLLNGQETSALATATICHNQTGVFQKFQKYKMTLANNVGISQMTDEINADRLTQSLSQAEVKLDNSFPAGQDTILSREFDGVDLSGGQWQRVAIARGFYRIHDMIVLDEPTASIDPIEETIIYNQFAEISRGKTAIIVTHRLGAARIADRILVMDQGRLLEQGTHAELMLLGGKYADMYKAQAQWYARAAD